MKTMRIGWYVRGAAGIVLGLAYVACSGAEIPIGEDRTPGAGGDDGEASPAAGGTSGSGTGGSGTSGSGTSGSGTSGDTSCAEVKGELDAELASVRSCTADAQCGQELLGTSCGCTRNLVARLDADISRVEELIGLNCGGLASTCDCPTADGFACVGGTCAWNYVVPSPPAPSDNVGACPNAGGNVVLTPDATGWMDPGSPCNDAGVQGFWYPFGDAYLAGHGDARCITYGLHAPEACSTIAAPDPSLSRFPNVSGMMHTAGHIALVIPCEAGVETSGCPTADFWNIWGAGIGFDFNGSDDPTPTRSAWNPSQYGVVGIRFTIDAVPLPGIRVEFPILLTDEEAAANEPPLPSGSTSDEHSTMSPYWGAQALGDSKWPKSPVIAGVNTILFATDIQPPTLGRYTFDPSRLLGVRFHVVADANASKDYEFTISNVELLRDPNQP
jgi:hypothetical protein